MTGCAGFRKTSHRESSGSSFVPLIIWSGLRHFRGNGAGAVTLRPAASFVLCVRYIIVAHCTGVLYRSHLKGRSLYAATTMDINCLVTYLCLFVLQCCKCIP